ncbi:MAG: sugar ABC transporter permease [Spirochaetaceae bacterium]
MKKKTLEKTNWFTVLSFLLPGFSGFILFVFIPMITTLGFAFTNYSGGPKWKFVGLRNFTQLIDSSIFRQSLAITIQFVIITVIFQIVLGLLFASILNGNIRGKKFFRSLFFMPNVLSTVGISLAFSLIFHPNSGAANKLLLFLGLEASSWLTSPDTALYTIIFVTVWMTFGYYMIIFLGGLQSINTSLYEAASIDGAGSFTTFFKITLPMLSPTMFFALTMSIIGSFKVFGQVFMMTGGQLGGGPAGSTNVVVFDVYINSFINYRFGYAAAESLLLLIIILTVTLLQYRQQKKWVTYDI